MARDKSKGKRAGMGGPKPKASKRWQTHSSSFLLRHLSAEPLVEPPPDDDTTPATTTPATTTVTTEAGSVTSTLIPQSSDTSRSPCHAADSDSDSEEQLPLSARLTARTPTKRPVPTEHSTTAAPAWLAELHSKLDSMHGLLRWLAKTRFPVEKQGGLARILGMSSPQLSAFLNKKNQHGQASVQELDRIRRSILRKLEAAGLPLVIEAPAVDTPGTRTRGSVATPPTTSRAADPPPPARPSVSILTLDLAEATGNEGGEVRISNLGSPVDDPRWQLKVGGSTLFLRNGLRGFRTVGARSALGGRTFEFFLESLNSASEPAVHGGPLWVAREFTGSVNDLASQRIIGRARGTDGKLTGWSSPQLLWNAISDAYQVGTRFNGLIHCGLTHPALQDALDAVRPELSPTPEASHPFGERKGLAHLDPDGSWLRELGVLAGDAFIDAMRSVCPSNPEFAFEQLLKRKSFQLRFLPEEMRNGLSKKAIQKLMLETPLVKGLVDTYHKLQGFKLKRQHLSLIAPHLPYDTVRKLFGVSRCAHSSNMHRPPD